MKPIKCATYEATAKTPRGGHELWCSERLFDCIASKRGKQRSLECSKFSRSCTPTRNGPFHRKARGPDPASGFAVQKVGCLVFILSSHEDPLPTGWFTALHRRSFPEGSLQSSIADRTIGIGLHSNFTVALPDVAGTASNPPADPFSNHRIIPSLMQMNVHRAVLQFLRLLGGEPRDPSQATNQEVVQAIQPTGEFGRSAPVLLVLQWQAYHAHRVIPVFRLHPRAVECA